MKQDVVENWLVNLLKCHFWISPRRIFVGAESVWVSWKDAMDIFNLYAKNIILKNIHIQVLVPVHCSVLWTWTLDEYVCIWHAISGGTNLHIYASLKMQHRFSFCFHEWVDRACRMFHTELSLAPSSPAVCHHADSWHPDCNEGVSERNGPLQPSLKGCFSNVRRTTGWKCPSGLFSSPKLCPCIF